MKKFYFVGCSATNCDDIPELQRPSLSWPAIISKHYDATHTNDAMPGGTNSRTVSQVLQNIGVFDRYYIQWTVENRFTLYHSQNWHGVNFNEQIAHQLYQSEEYFTLFGKIYYTHWSPPVFEFKRWLEQLILLQSILEKNQCNYIMMCAKNKLWKHFTVNESEFISSLSKIHDITNLSDDMILAQYHHIQKLLSKINFNNFISPTDFYLDSAREIFPVGPTDHPLEDGMSYIANTILNIEKGKNT